MKLHIVLACTMGGILAQAGAQTYDTNNVSVQTLAGSAFSGYLDGVGQQTEFSGPKLIVADSIGNLFVWDSGNQRIRKIAPDATVSTFAGGGSQSTGIGTNVSLAGISFSGMTIHSNVIWMISSSQLYKITTDGNVAYTFLPFSYPAGLAVDSQGNLYASVSSRIYKFTAAGWAVFAGSGNYGLVDGTGLLCSFQSPGALAVDAADNVYVSDCGPSGCSISGGYVIRRIDQDQNVVTIAGSKSMNVFADADGVGFGASFYHNLNSMFVDDFGNVIMACGPSVRKMTATTNVLTLAGNFQGTGYADGPGNLVLFNGASGVCVSQGMVFVADSGNNRIRQISFNATAQPVLPANLQLNTYAGLEIVGSVGRTYQIQASPDMNTWSTVATLLLTSSPYLWIDQNPARGSKFYRAWLMP